jgi:transcriptional regulator GlxA family with amidase domain
MNGVTITAQMTLVELPDVDAIIVGSGSKIRQYAADPMFLSSLTLDPTRQIIGSQCSGALLLAKLGLLDDVPVCTDSSRSRGSLRPARTSSINRSSLPALSPQQADACLASTSRLG